MKPMSCVNRRDEIAPSPRDHSSTFLCLLSLRFVAEIPSSSDTRFIFSFYQPHSFIRLFMFYKFSVIFRSLISDTNPVVLRVIRQFPSNLTFISSSPFSISSETLDRAGLNTKTAYISLTLPPVCTLLAVCLCTSTPAGLLSSQTTSLRYTVWKCMARSVSLAGASWGSALLCIGLRATLASRHTAVCTDPHLSIRHIRGILGVLRVYTLVLRVLAV